MKHFARVIAVFSICAALSLAPLSAGATSTINPNNPAQNSPLSSSVLRQNFLAAYNDVNGQQALTIPYNSTGYGLVPPSGSDPSNYVFTVGGWSSGYVTGPGSSTVGYVPLWSNTAGTGLGVGLPVGMTGNSIIVETSSGGLISPSIVPTLNQNTTGNAASATAVATTSSTSNAPYYLLGVASTANGNQAAVLTSGISYNPSASSVTATTFNGALNGSAPAGSLSGTALASNVVTSSLTALGVVTTGTWNGSVVQTAYGGTGATTPAAAAKSLSNVRIVATGTTDSVLSTDISIFWNSSSTGAKAESIPACSSGSAGRPLHFKDEVGTAGQYNIVLTPASGTIDNGSTFSMNASFQAVGLQCDGSSNWVVM